MSRNKELVKNASYVVIGSIGAKLVAFLMLPLYTSWLSPEDYGVTDIIDTYAGLLLFMVALDISDAIFIFPVGASKGDITKYFSTGMMFSLACCCVCAIIFYFISLFNFQNEFFKNIWLIYGILVTNLFQKYTQDFCRGIKKMSVFSWTGIIQAFGFAIMSCFLIPFWGVTGFVVACMISYLLSGVFAFVYSKSYNYLSLTAFSYPFLKKMLAYSIPLVPTSIMWWLVSSLNRPLMEQYTGMFAIGLFAVANKLPSFVNLVFGFFQKAWIVTVVEEYQKPDFSDYYNQMFRVIMAVQSLMCIILTIVSKMFVTIMTSEAYYDAWRYIPLLSLSVLLSNTSAFCGTIFSAYRKTIYIFYSVCVGGVAAVVLNFLLIPYVGLLGACLAICFSHLLNMISRIIFSSKMVKFESSLYVFTQILIITIIYLAALQSNLYICIIIYIVGFLMYYQTNRNVLKVLISKMHQRLQF